MESKIKIFETGIEEGIMSTNPKFYNDGITQLERENNFKNVRIKAGNKYGFNGLKILKANQKNEKNCINYKDGKFIEITNQHMQKEDFWYEDLQADILILKEKYKNVVIANQMADCPILIIEDRLQGITALSHCGGSYIDRELPKQTGEVLIKEYNSNTKYLFAYIGSCIKKDSYIYDKYPKWAKNKTIWLDNITKQGDNYHIDLVNAIIKQLKDIGITNIDVSQIDTATSDKFYSHSRAVMNHKEKLGQNLVGFFYK